MPEEQGKENSTEKKIKSITVGDHKIELKEPMSKEVTDKLTDELTEAMNSEGEWSYSPDLLEKVERITLNPGKQEVTPEQKQIDELKRNNDLLKTQLKDINSKIESIGKEEPKDTPANKPEDKGEEGKKEPNKSTDTTDTETKGENKNINGGESSDNGESGEDDSSEEGGSDDSGDQDEQ